MTDFAKRRQGVDDAGPTSSARSSITCPKCAGIPSPKDILGHHIGEPKKLTYYADILKLTYRALAAATPRVKVRHAFGSSNEGPRSGGGASSGPTSRSGTSEAYRTYSGPAGRSAGPVTPEQATQIIAKAKPLYHLSGGLAQRARSDRRRC